jgi:hypothetical protein
MAQGQLRLELLPLEISDMIYECLGVMACKRELDFQGVKVSYRHVAQVADSKLRCFHGGEYQSQGPEKTATDAKAVMALASTRRVFHADLMELLLGFTMLLIELDEA